MFCVFLEVYFIRIKPFFPAKQMNMHLRWKETAVSFHLNLVTLVLLYKMLQI